jgi:asparagine synthase (glutamine-hydrolysing)
MCGLCGIYERSRDLRSRSERVASMTAALVHRGPDDQGFYADDDIALGFRRLAVLDLETGQQPIRLEGDRAVIVLNGEIYNFHELRKELAGRQRFRTKGDVEVVLRLYAEQGIDCVSRLNGMFAFALWDKIERTLYLARDRFGIKPLFVCREGDTMAFASEVTALLAGGFPRDRALDLGELRHYLWTKHLSPTGSLLAGVRSLPPATVVTIRDGGWHEHRYWAPPAPLLRATPDAERELGPLLHAAVERQLVADVPVGVFLSGGLDSSTIVALARLAGATPLRTFSVGFSGPGAVSELPAARRVALWAGSEHSEIVMDPGQVCTDLERIAARLDGPLGDATTIPTWYMSKLARERATVALSGEGADELFGGYPRQRYDAALDVLGARGRAALPALLRLTGRSPSPRFRNRLAMASSLSRYLDWGSIFRPHEIDALAEVALPRHDTLLERQVEMAARFLRLAGEDPINARLQADRELFLPGDLLPKVDRMSMAHSLEVRVPFLDNDVAELMLACPGRVKVGWTRGKRLLRRVVAPLLPAEVLTRGKQGFDVPIGAWLRGPLRVPLLDTLTRNAVSQRGMWRAERVGALIDEHLDGRADHGEQLWLLLALELWQRQILDHAPEWRP